MQALPQVQSAGVINDLPATAGSSGASRTIFLPGDSDFQKVVLQRPVAMVRSITPGLSEKYVEEVELQAHTGVWQSAVLPNRSS
ncbi:MAG: hypothetical protein SFV54_18595 [Bryobacteraceae bacterium]|nr:hypothetical protein [Bryobacteraceae bacterium]